MTLVLSNRVALITGGSRGIGRAIVTRFVEAGASVAFTYRSSADEAEDLARSLEDIGQVLALRADARDYALARDTVAHVSEQLGPIDILVNNSATADYGPFVKMTEESWDRTIEGVLKSAFNYTHHVLGSMCERQRGSIISISSINGIRGREGSSAYGAAKAAINGLTRTLAREAGLYDVRVNAIAPGYVDTLSQAGTPELIKQLVRNESAIKEFTQPTDIAEAALFLASDAARKITGHVLQIDAGQWV